MEKDTVSPPSSPFHGYTEEEVRSVSISVGLSKPTVFVYDDVEVEYVLLSDEEAKEKEELYQQQDWSGVEEQVEVTEKKTVPWTYMSGKAPLLTGTKSRIKVNIIDKYPSSDMAFSHLPKTETVLLKYVPVSSRGRGERRKLQSPDSFYHSFNQEICKEDNSNHQICLVASF